MKSEDWTTGMQNEAASVQDARWRAETQWAALGYPWRSTVSAALLYLTLGAVQVTLVQGYWRQHVPQQLWLGTMIVVAVVGMLLGLRRVGPLAAGIGALAYVPGAWLAVVVTQAVLGDAALHDPGFADEGAVVLAVLAASATGLGQSARQLWAAFTRPA